MYVLITKLKSSYSKSRYVHRIVIKKTPFYNICSSEVSYRFPDIKNLNKEII